MKHRKAFKKLNRTAAHRKSLLRNLATSLVLNEKITTTLPKAKALKPVADKLITLAKKNTLHAKRQAMQFLFAINQDQAGNAKKLTPVHKLFNDLAPRYAERNGGYTRIIRTENRNGDNAPMAIISFVEGAVAAKAPKKRSRRVVKKTTETTSSSSEANA